MAKRGPSKLNLLLAVDKPVGCTSHDVVARVRRAVGERRVGHAGTLDPLASGVLVVGVGQGTRLMGRLVLDRKSYVARIAFGSETTTDDAEGEVVRACTPAPELARKAFAEKVLASFLGPQMQVPPVYSAISVGGVRAYARARAGEEVELPARPIEVFAAELIAIDDAEGGIAWTVSFTVSKGTYIRSLARDIGRAAGGAAHIAALRRTASGDISVRSCVELDGLDAHAACAGCLDPVAALGMPARTLTEAGLQDVLCGRPVRPSDAPCPSADALSEAPAEGALAALVHAGELRAIARVERGLLRMCDVFPQGIGGVRG